MTEKWRKYRISFRQHRYLRMSASDKVGKLFKTEQRRLLFRQLASRNRLCCSCIQWFQKVKTYSFCELYTKIQKRQKFKTHRFINVNKYNRNNINDNTERINVKNKIEESQETV